MSYSILPFLKLAIGRVTLLCCVIVIICTITMILNCLVIVAIIKRVGFLAYIYIVVYGLLVISPICLMITHVLYDDHPIR